MGIAKSINNTSVQNSTTAYIKFAKKHNLILTKNLGREKAPVGGILSYVNFKDNLLIQGLAEGYDFTALQRITANKLTQTKTVWNVIQLGSVISLPHIFIDGFRHGSNTYKNEFAAFGHYQNADNQLTGNLEYFPNFFHTYAAAETTHVINSILVPDILNLIYGYGAGLDYEFDDKFIRIYYPSSSFNYNNLNDMFILSQNLVSVIENVFDN